MGRMQNLRQGPGVGPAARGAAAVGGLPKPARGAR